MGKKIYRLIEGKKYYLCEKCGDWKPYERIKNRHRCVECGLKEVVEVCEQMIRKEGKYFDKWREALEDYLKIYGKKKNRKNSNRPN